MKKRLLLIAIAACLLAGAFWYIFSQQIIPPDAELGQPTPLNNWHAAFHSDKEFYGDLSRAVASDVGGQKIYGGIVSHHFLIAKEIANFFATLKNQSPEVIIIVGPNHFNVGDGDILVSNYPFKTPWGEVRPEQNIIAELLQNQAARQDEDPFSREHSVSALVGFVKYYFPDTKIVPLIVKRNTSQAKIEKLARALNEVLPKSAVVVASVDFSHHLDGTAAQFHDQKSVSAINNFDYPLIFESEIDSPPAIATLLKYLERRGAQRLVYKNINSADFTNNPDADDVTSYVFAHFLKGAVQADDKISVLSFGDMMLGRAVAESMASGTDPFEHIRGPEGNFLKGVDFISANLEGPITLNDDCAAKAYSFKFKPEIAKLIAQHGFNLVNLANNHAGDCRLKGLEDTKYYLAQNGIDFFGQAGAANSYVEKEINGQKIIFMGIDVTLHSDNLEPYYELIKQIKKSDNRVLVNIHWGFEYHDNPSQNQKLIAHALIDSGADLIIGHHPHVTQPAEIYKNKAIFYSLGNFIFDQIGQKTNEGMGVGAVFSQKEIQYFLFPYQIKNFQPTLLTPERATTACAEYLSAVQPHDGCYFVTTP